MSIKDTSKRIMITCDEFVLKQFDELCHAFSLSYTQFFSLFADYLHFLDNDKVDFITFVKARYSKHVN